MVRYALLWLLLIQAGVSSATQSTYQHRICVPHLPIITDMASSNVSYDIESLTASVYDTLVTVDETGAIQPSLAMSWQVLDDGLLYRFKLRSDVQFHHLRDFNPTRNLNAEDVAFSFNRLLRSDAYYAKVGDRLAMATLFPREDIRSIFARGLTVDIRLKKADSELLAKLSGQDSSIVSLEYAQFLESENNRNAFALVPVGTGPFRFESRGQSHLDLTRFEQHWRGPAGFASLRFLAFPEDLERLRRVREGACAQAVEMGPRILDQMSSFEGLSVHRSPIMSVFFLALDTRLPPWNDVRARKALSLAINRERILRLLFSSSSGSYASTSVHPKLLGLDPVKKPEFDPSRARRLLQKASANRSVSLKITSFDLARPHNPDPRRMMQLVVEDLENVGIDVQIDWVPVNSIMDRLGSVEEGAYEGLLMGYSADVPLAVAMASTLLGCIDQQPNVVNFSRLCDPQVLSVLSQAASTEQAAERQHLYRAAANAALAKMQYINILHAEQIDVVRADVQGVKRLSNGLLDFRQGNLRQAQ